MQTVRTTSLPYRLAAAPIIGALLWAAVSTPLAAQQAGATATLAGTVVDQTGNVLPGAAVTAKSESTSAAFKTTTDGTGRFSVADLPAGVYTVEVSAPNFARSRREGVKLAAGVTEEISIAASLAALPQTISVDANVSVAAQMAVSQSPLEARSAESSIPGEFVENFTSPVADYTEVLNMAPGTFGINPNGVGMGDSKTYFRGFADGQYTMTFDGIPFEDTNSPTHHSWAFIPGQWIGGANFDRSPGSAATIGPTNFGGSINLLSRPVRQDQDIRASVNYGSFNTALYDLNYDSGQFGKSNLTLDLHQMKSDGYQTHNDQKRDGGFLKYQFLLSDKTVITIFGGLTDLFTHTPNTKGPSRAQVAQFGDNYLMSGDPTAPNYYGFSLYHVQTDFEYIGVTTDLGGGWRFDNKAYTYRYWNKQNYNNSTTTVSLNSGIDKLNGYRKMGDVMYLTHDGPFGVLRTGAWYEWAYTDRYQIPTDPRTWQDTPFGNFHEHFLTQSLQPFVEYEVKATSRLSITPGVKLAYYNMSLNQYADNGKTIGCPGGVEKKDSNGNNVCIGGVAFVTHGGAYNSFLPSLDARYTLRDNWAVYAQYSTGSVIPPSSVFDTAGAAVSVLPKPTLAKTYQTGSKWKFNRFTLDVDAYYTHFQNPYATTPDINGEPIYYQTGPSNTKGVEFESNIYLNYGFNLYVNGTAGNAKYQNTGLWVANTPKNTETLGLSYQHRAWDAGFFDKRIGPMWNDAGSYNQAIPIEHFNLTNAFFNYTVKGSSPLRGTKFRLSVNNLLDKHNIVGITAAAASAHPAEASGDVLTLLPGRSVMLTVTFGFAPSKR
jgi:iron complex outermembrane receptor protein